MRFRWKGRTRRVSRHGAASIRFHNVKPIGRKMPGTQSQRQIGRNRPHLNTNTGPQCIALTDCCRHLCIPQVALLEYSCSHPNADDPPPAGACRRAETRTHLDMDRQLPGTGIRHSDCPLRSRGSRTFCNQAAVAGRADHAPHCTAGERGGHLARPGARCRPESAAGASAGARQHAAVRGARVRPAAAGDDRLLDWHAGAVSLPASSSAGNLGPGRRSHVALDGRFRIQL